MNVGILFLYFKILSVFKLLMRFGSMFEGWRGYKKESNSSPSGHKILQRLIHCNAK